MAGMDVNLVNMMIMMMYAGFIISMIALVLSFFAIKRVHKKEIERGDIINKILKERKKSIRVSGKIPGVKHVVFTGGSSELKRRPGFIMGRYGGSIEWEYITEILVKRFGRTYYLIVPNEYVTDPNRRLYSIRARGATFHTWAWVPIVEDKDEQKRVFRIADEFLDFLIKTQMRFEDKEMLFRGALEASSATSTKIPRFIIERREEIEPEEGKE